MPRKRPFIYVLAGVNGAGKSSIGGHLLTEQGLNWYNPDSFARLLVMQMRLSPAEANAAAWQAGRKRLEAAIERGENFALETTLGAHTIPQLLIAASRTHDVQMWYCGLASVELHLQRIAARVASGGHDIDEAKVRERWNGSRQNLIRLLPHLTHLQVFDNSTQAAPGEAIAAPVLVLEMARGRLLAPRPSDARKLAIVPAWAMPIVESSLRLRP